MVINLEAGYFRQDDFLYIPCKDSIGYFCIGNLGIPIGCVLLEGGRRRYWIGKVDAGYACMQEVKVSVMPAMSGVVDVRFEALDILTLDSMFWSVRFYLSDGLWFFIYPALSGMQEFYHVPAELLAKCYLLF